MQIFKTLDFGLLVGQIMFEYVNLGFRKVFFLTFSTLINQLIKNVIVSLIKIKIIVSGSPNLIIRKHLLNHFALSGKLTLGGISVNSVRENTPQTCHQHTLLLFLTATRTAECFM